MRMTTVAAGFAVVNAQQNRTRPILKDREEKRRRGRPKIEKEPVHMAVRVDGWIGSRVNTKRRKLD